MNSYPAGQVVPLPPPVGSGLGTGLTGSAGLVAPPLHMPGTRIAVGSMVDPLQCKFYVTPHEVATVLATHPIKHTNFNCS